MKTKIILSPLHYPASGMKRRPITELRLSAKDALRLDGKLRGTKITVLSGKTWVTQANDLQDYLLASGETLEIKKNGSVVAQGWPEAVLRVGPTA